jgi:uncharacterized membrane-anchored protein
VNGQKKTTKREEGSSLLVKRTKASIRGIVIVDKKTKRLLTRIKPGQIAVLCHEDIDEIAAYDLIAAKVGAIVNAAPSISGTYMSQGAKILINKGIPLYDCTDQELLTILQDGDSVEIAGDRGLLVARRGTVPISRISHQVVEEKWKIAQENMHVRLSKFIDNTLAYAQQEKDFYIVSLPALPLKTKLTRRHVLIVIRGKHFREDLKAIYSYIADYQPVLIGVDGGADALLEMGWKPDLIIGDMDSISDQALCSGAEVIIHAYPNGVAPGKERVERLGLAFHVLPASGTSEDVAMLFAYERGAEWIVALGAHSNMVDFLEKGRKGMASTVLVRMKVGTKLIDAKGVSMLYQKRVRWKNFFLISSAAAVPIVAASLMSPAVQQIWHLLWLQIKLFVL